MQALIRIVNLSNDQYSILYSNVFYLQYIKLRSWWFRRNADKRYEKWQKERLRGFEADEEKIKKWKGKSLAKNPGKNIEIDIPVDQRPSTSRSTGDPLAKARVEWNKAMKKEYEEKFKKWTSMKNSMSGTV